MGKGEASAAVVRAAAGEDQDLARLAVEGNLVDPALVLALQVRGVVPVRMEGGAQVTGAPIKEGLPNTACKPVRPGLRRPWLSRNARIGSAPAAPCAIASAGNTTPKPTIGKPFDVLAEGLVLQNGRGNRTPIELFMREALGLEPAVARLIAAA